MNATPPTEIPGGTPPTEIPAGTSVRETRILAVLWLAILGGSIVLFSLWVGHFRRENLRYLWVEAVMLASVPGKFAVFGGLSSKSPLDPWGVALLGTIVDTFLAVTLALGLEPFLRLPRIGTWLRNAHARAAKALHEYPGLKRMAFWGAAIFVALPLPGSGWMGGTFASQLVGLSRLMGVAAIAVGTAMVTIVFASLAEFVGAEAEPMLKSPWLYVGGTIVLALIVWILWRKFRVLLRQG
jgi:uncharacterized membrane protein